MTEQPESPDQTGLPLSGSAPAGPAPYPPAHPPGPSPYAYPPGPPYAGPQGYQAGPYLGAYPPPPMPYGDYPPGTPMAPHRNGMGVAALVLAIVALVASCSVAGGLALGALAIILGILGRGRVKRGEANNGGVAMAGIILGALAVLVSLAFVAFYVGMFNDFGGRDLVSCVQNAGGDNDKVQLCMDEFQQRVDESAGTRPGG